MRFVVPRQLSRGCGVLALVCACAHLVLAASPRTPADTGASQSGGAILNSGNCTSCHVFDSVLTHPVNITPSMSTPGSLPLQGGKLTCLTCHEDRPGHAESGAVIGVRGGEATALCAQCHTSPPGGTKSMHTSGALRAHLQTAQPVMGARTRAANTATGDSETRSCLGCHDGVSGMEAGSHAMRGDALLGAQEHPIGVPMIQTERTRGGDFRLAHSIDKRLRLFDGVIGCGTCHSPYSREASQLVISNRGSKLCLNCHTQ